MSPYDDIPPVQTSFISLEIELDSVLNIDNILLTFAVKTVLEGERGTEDRGTRA